MKCSKARQTLTPLSLLMEVAWSSKTTATRHSVTTHKTTNS